MCVSVCECVSVWPQSKFPFILEHTHTHTFSLTHYLHSVWWRPTSQQQQRCNKHAAASVLKADVKSWYQKHEIKTLLQPRVCRRVWSAVPWSPAAWTLWWRSGKTHSPTFLNKTLETPAEPDRSSGSSLLSCCTLHYSSGRDWRKNTFSLHDYSAQMFHNNNIITLSTGQHLKRPSSPLH